MRVVDARDAVDLPQLDRRTDAGEVQGASELRALGAVDLLGRTARVAELLHQPEADLARSGVAVHGDEGEHTDWQIDRRGVEESGRPEAVDGDEHDDRRDRQARELPWIHAHHDALPRATGEPHWAG